MTASPRAEAIRKTIHVLLSLVAATVVWRLPRREAAIVFAAATFVALAVELARRAGDRFGPLFQHHLGHLLRDGERDRLTGATTLAMGYTAAVVVFATVPALVGIVVAGVADAVAAVVGRRFGRLRYPGGKTLEGSLSFFIVGVATVAILVPAFHPVIVLAVAGVLTGVEAFALPVNDNLYLPVVTAAVVHGAILLTGATFLS